MSSDSSSECTQEEMPLVEVKVEPDSDSDSHDPLSVIGSETSCDPLSPADNTRLHRGGDPLSPSRTATNRNEPVLGKKSTMGVRVDKPDDEDSMSDLIEETSYPPEDPLNAHQTTHNVPTLIGLLGKNGAIIGKRVVYVPKPVDPLSVEARNPQSKPTPEDDDSSGVVQISPASKKYTCLRCGFQTDFDNDLREHMKTRHPEGLRTENQKKTQKDAVTKPLKCLLCNTYFPKEDMLNVHLALQHPVKQVEAEKLKSKTLTGPRAKLIPERADCAEIIKPGVKLSHEFKDEIKKLAKTGLKRLACDQCKFITTKYCYLKKHQRKIHSGRIGVKHVCEHCSFSTSKYESLEKHQKTHEEKRPYGCDICEFSSYKKSRLKQHRRVKHGIPPDSGQCDSTTVELDSSTKGAEAEINKPNKNDEKRPFITGDT